MTSWWNGARAAEASAGPRQTPPSRVGPRGRGRPRAGTQTDAGKSDRESRAADVGQQGPVASVGVLEAGPGRAHADDAAWSIEIEGAAPAVTASTTGAPATGSGVMPSIWSMVGPETERSPWPGPPSPGRTMAHVAGRGQGAPGRRPGWLRPRSSSPPGRGPAGAAARAVSGQRGCWCSCGAAVHQGGQLASRSGWTPSTTPGGQRPVPGSVEVR